MALAGLALPDLVAHAQEANDVPYFFAQATGGYAVYKSTLVQSNETSSSIGYGFGGYAGDRRNVGFALMRDQGSFAFELNNSTIAYQLQDMHLRYRYQLVYAGVVIAQSQWKIDAPPDLDNDTRPDPDATAAPVMEAMGTGYGVNTGLDFAFWRRNIFALDVTYITAQTVMAKAVPDLTTGDSSTLIEREVELGSRIDLDVGVRFEISRKFYGMAGFRYRTASLGSDGVSANEVVSATYVGLRFELGR